MVALMLKVPLLITVTYGTLITDEETELQVQVQAFDVNKMVLLLVFQV